MRVEWFCVCKERKFWNTSLHHDTTPRLLLLFISNSRLMVLPHIVTTIYHMFFKIVWSLHARVFPETIKTLSLEYLLQGFPAEDAEDALGGRYSFLNSIDVRNAGIHVLDNFAFRGKNKMRWERKIIIRRKNKGQTNIIVFL